MNLMNNFDQLRSAQHGNPDHQLPMGPRLALGTQHMLAMFASNVGTSIVVGAAAGFVSGSDDMVYLIQMAMMFAGVATLFQTIGFGMIGAKLPVMQGTSIAFVPVMINVVKSSGMAALMGSIIVSGLFHAMLGTFIGRLRHWFPPLVMGLVITTIGLYVIPVGIRFASGGAAPHQMSDPSWGDLDHWTLAMFVMFTALGCKFFTRGFTSSAAILIGLATGYYFAIVMERVDLTPVMDAPWFALPIPLKHGIEFNFAAILGMCFITFVSAIETIGDISGITKGGAGREPTQKELAGGTYADGLGSAVAGVFGALPNTSFSQNVGIVSMTGVMSRGVVTVSGVLLIMCGFVPKIGAFVASMPIEVLGGAMILMFGMIVSTGVSILSQVAWTRRNMMILATSLSIGLGLKSVPQSMQHLPDTLAMLMTSGLLPVAVIAVVMNLVLPESIDG